MHNLKEIRKDFENFQKSLEKRSVDIDFNKVKKFLIYFHLRCKSTYQMSIFSNIQINERFQEDWNLS